MVVPRINRGEQIHASDCLEREESQTPSEDSKIIIVSKTEPTNDKVQQSFVHSEVVLWMLSFVDLGRWPFGLFWLGG